MKKEKSSAQVFHNNAYMMKMAWRISPSWVVLCFISNIVDQFGWVFNTVIFMRLIVRGLERGSSFTEMIAIIALLMLVNASIDVYQKWFNIKYIPEASLRSYEKLNAMLFDQSANVDLACYEDPEFYNKYTLATKEAGERMGGVVNSVSDMVILPAIVAYVVYLMLGIDRLLPILILFPIIGTFLFGKHIESARYQQTLENNINTRKKGYTNRVFYLAQYAKEIRLSNVAKIIRGLYNEGYEDSMKVYKKYGKRILPLSFLNDTFSNTIVFYGVFLYSAYRVIVSKTITVSEFIILFGAMLTVTMMLGYISEHIRKCYQNALFCNNLRSFLEYQPSLLEDQSGESVQQFNHELEFRDVSFTYKGSETETLHHINLKIKKGEKIAIVGCNGAGKSTFNKLLLRLYDPTSGEILLDGKNIKTYNLQEYRKLLSAAFQDQRVFSMSVADNVSKNKEKAVQALKQSGVWNRVLRMPAKEDSILTREFDSNGVVLSGGETQKVAIARAFAKEFDIGIFDEPSSALDPIAEYKLFESMMEVFQDKTVIFISHRLSSARLTDHTYLFDNGTILEEGNHDELMKKNGVYAKMFAMQAEKYIENEYTFLEGGLE